MADHMTVDQDEHDEDATVPEPTEPVPPRRSKTESQGPMKLWEATSRPGLPHPCWWHPLNLTTWTGAAGIGIAGTDLSNLAFAGGTAAAAVIGMGIGAGSVHSPDDTTAHYVYAGGVLGGVTGAAMAGFAWIASANDLFNDIWQPAPWFGLALGGAAFGAAYTWLRFRLAAARNPKSRLHHQLKIRKSEGTWGEIMQRAGFGNVEVIDHHENWSGYTVMLRLDPNRLDSSAAVVAARAKITTVAARTLADDDVTIGPDSLTILATTDASVVSVRVKLREVLTSVIETPAAPAPVTAPGTPVDVGLWEDGEKIEVDECGPHGLAVGASGSGKSTYEHGLTAQWSRRPFTLNWVAGLSKFESFIAPWFAPLVDGRVSRPVYDMVGGGSRAGAEEFWSAAYVVAAAHALMTHRQASRDTPRLDGNLVVSREHPRVVVQLDEIDVVVKFKLTHPKTGEQVKPRVTLPNGQNLTVFEMLVDIGSKGRSEGVELEISTQRLTDEFWGGVSVRSLITNVQRRGAFYTTAAHDAGEMLKGTRLNAMSLRHHSMFMALKSDAKPAAGKAAFYDKATIAEYAIRADQADTIGTLGEQEAAALGDLYAGRWNPNRVASVLHYFRADESESFTEFIADMATGTTATPGAAGAVADTTAVAGTENTPVRAGRQALRDAIARVKDNAPAEGDLSGVLDEIRNLPTISDEERNTRRTVGVEVPELLRSILTAFADHAGHVSTEDIAAALGRVTSESTDAERQAAKDAVAAEVRTLTGLTTKQRRNSAFYGEDRPRGFLVEELRDAAARIARGEDPNGTTYEG